MRKKEKVYQNTQSLIADGVEIKGELNSKGSIRIDGNIEGKLNIEGDVILGEKGKIKGEVRVNNIIIAGNIEGNVAAKDRLEITATGIVGGDVNCSTLVIEEGGALNGTSKMSKQNDKGETSKNNDNKKK